MPDLNTSFLETSHVAAAQGAEMHLVISGPSVHGAVETYAAGEAIGWVAKLNVSALPGEDTPAEIYSLEEWPVEVVGMGDTASEALDAIGSDLRARLAEWKGRILASRMKEFPDQAHVRLGVMPKPEDGLSYDHNCSLCQVGLLAVMPLKTRRTQAWDLKWNWRLPDLYFCGGCLDGIKTHPQFIILGAEVG